MKPYAYFLVVITLSVLRPLTTFIHEMGHAIPSLLYTKGIVTIYVGSYGDPDKSIHFTVGRLKVYFKYNPLLWDSGLCVPGQGDISITKNMVIILMGPLTSLCVGVFYTIKIMIIRF